MTVITRESCASLACSMLAQIPWRARYRRRNAQLRTFCTANPQPSEFIEVIDAVRIG